MAKARKTVTYDLRNGRKVVYKGTTNNPERREKEHRDEGKKFTKMTVTSRRMTDDGAKLKEEKQLEQYRSSHGRENPKYNKDKDG